MAREGEETGKEKEGKERKSTEVGAVWKGAYKSEPVVYSTQRASTDSGARFTKYLTTILLLSYDNAKVTIDLRRTSNLLNILRRTQCFY